MPPTNHPSARLFKELGSHVSEQGESDFSELMRLRQQNKERGKVLLARFRAAYAVNQKYYRGFVDLMPQYESEKPDAKRMNMFKTIYFKDHGIWSFTIKSCDLLVRSLIWLNGASTVDTGRYLQDLKSQKSDAAAIERIHEQYEDTYPTTKMEVWRMPAPMDEI